RFLAGRIARKPTRPRAKQAWAAAVGAVVLLPLPALALPVCRPPGSLAEPWAPPGAWLLPPALLLALYLAGLWRLWRRAPGRGIAPLDRKSTRRNSSHVKNSYAVFWLENNSD